MWFQNLAAQKWSLAFLVSIFFKIEKKIADIPPT
jgi:hypothetical protein